MSVEDYIDNYLCQNLYPFEEKITKEYIEDILNDGDIEYDKDDLDNLLDFALEIQESIDSDRKRELVNSLLTDLDYYIEDYDNSDKLTSDDIGKILVQLANSYFGSY